MGKISVTNIVNPDDEKPELRFITTAPRTTELSGAREKLVEFEIKDNLGGSGILEAQLLYSPDAGVRYPYKVLKEYKDLRFVEGAYSIKFCTPNKVHPKPTFKLVAVDKNKNDATVYLGSGIDEEFAIVPSPPMVPTITSSNGTLTNAGSTTITIDSCRKDLCASDAVYYEDPTNKTFISIHDSAGTPTWVSCEDVLEDGLTLPLPVDGSVSYTVQTKEEDVDLEGNPLPPIVSLGNDPADTDDPLDPNDSFFNPALPPTVITINKDSTDPTAAVVTAAGPMNTHNDFSVTFNFADSNSGIESAKLFYSPDAGSTYPYLELGSFDTGSPVTMNFCVPHKDHTSGAFQVRATDLAGNTITQTQTGFTTALTANPVLPNVASVTTVTPRSNNTSTVRIDACPQTACTSGYPSLYGPIDNQTYIAVSPAAPAAGAPIWQSCANVLTNGYTYTLPSTPTGSGTHTAARLWVKSENMNQANDATLATVSTTSRALSLPWDYTAPATLGLDLGNIGTNRNLEILGTSILTGYSQGSFRLSPVCLDPTYLPPSGFIAGTVTVSANNVNVTGTGTSFTTEYRESDYIEINNTYTQIKTIISDTQLVLNENPGNTPTLVGSGLVASKAIPSYGGIYVQKGTTAPAGSAPEWQSCDSVNQTITFGDLVNGVNNLNFWVKDQGNNVSTSYLSFAVNYTAPILTVVDGPTISTQVADISINACGGGTRITHVLFNETGVQPAAGDAAWQTCSTAPGALKSDVLAPGGHVLKAYFKYNDNFVSVNPVDVVVNYLPQVAWVETPITNRPQTTYTLASCTGITDVFVNQGVAPLATDAGWQPCSTAPGAINYTLTNTGSQTVNFWYKSGSTVSSEFSEATVNFVPPSASIFGGSLVRTQTPPLSLNSCEGIDRIYIEVDDSLGASAPVLADFTGPNGRACTTALNGIIPPAVLGEGNHTYDVWYKFNDNYILDPWFSRVSITYLEADASPPPILAGEGATNPLVITLENTQSGTPEVVTSQAPRTNIINTSARALFTLNSCSPKASIPLAGTVTVATEGLVVTGSDPAFTSTLLPGDYIQIGAQTVKVKTIDGPTQLSLVLAHTAGATNSAATQVFPDDEITGMMVTTSGVKPLANDPFWLPCSTASTLLRTPTLANGPYTVSAWFKDAAGNVSNSAILKDIEITNGDNTPPDRPMVIVEGAPTLTSAPARLTIPNCLDVDQVYIETSDYPAAYTAPAVNAPEWQNCTTDIGSIIYNVDLAGSYTVSVWFKDAAGNLNAIPRDVAFIFDPAIGNLPEPIAYWTMDQTHILKNRVIDAKGNNHLYIWDPANVTQVAGRNKQALSLTGTNSYLFTENTSTLKPAISVTLSMWAYLSANDAGTKGLAGNGSYGLKLDGGNLTFYASRTYSVSVPTST